MYVCMYVCMYVLLIFGEPIQALTLQRRLQMHIITLEDHSLQTAKTSDNITCITHTSHHYTLTSSSQLKPSFYVFFAGTLSHVSVSPPPANDSNFEWLGVGRTILWTGGDILEFAKLSRQQWPESA